MNNLVLHILTPHSLKSIDKCQRYGHVNACGSHFKMTLKPIDWIYTHTAAANTRCVLFMTTKFKCAAW